MRIAIISPAKDVYSETFIGAHKEQINCDKLFYYNGFIPTVLEGKGKLGGDKKSLILLNKILYKFNKNYNNYAEVAFAKSLKENKVNAVLAEYGTTGAHVSSICKQLGIPLYVHFHGYDAYRKDILRDYSSLYKLMFDYATKIFVVSTAMYDQLINLGCCENKLVLNTYGPQEDFLAITPGFKRKKLIAVGRFVDKKAPYYTILAFNKVLTSHPDAKLYMAGDGVLFNTCVNLIKYLNLENSVVLLGVINPAEFKEHLEDSCLFVQHSIKAHDGDSEGTPVSILEAQAAGLPVVSTWHAGIPDVILDKKTGYLVDEGDVNGMAERICDVLSDLNKARIMGLEGKNRIAKNFSMRKHIEIIESLILKKN